MNPFNIHIEHEQHPLTLTILPENHQYKIIYDGKIAGALRQLDNDWELLAMEEIDPEGLPIISAEELKLEKLNLDTPTLNQITGEIENYIRA